MRQDFFFAGLGGQGIMFAGQVLARAAMAAGLEATWVPEYEPEVRGGAAMCTVVVADGDVGSPIVMRPHNMVLMEQRAVDKRLGTAAEGALVIVNATLARLPEDASGAAVELVPVPASELAAEAGSERCANIVALGALLALRPVVALDVAEAALTQALPAHRKALADVNVRALRLGFERGRRLAESR